MRSESKRFNDTSIQNEKKFPGPQQLKMSKILKHPAYVEYVASSSNGTRSLAQHSRKGSYDIGCAVAFKISGQQKS